MTKTNGNPCIRCGTDRIVLRIWKEKIYESIIINTETVCPDNECQKQVNLDNNKARDRNIAFKLRSQQRALDRKAMRDSEKAAKKHSNN